MALSSAGLLLGIDATYAANLTPTGCSLTRPEALAAFGADPARPFLSDQGNAVSATNAPSTAGTSISGTEASTSFVTELIAQRRVQETQICPVGFERIGGICQLVRKNVLQERSSSARSKPSTMTSLTGRAPSTQPRPPARPADLEIKPESGAKGSNAFWAEAFYDYEKRTGLGSPLAPASRAQQTSEFLFGGDHTFQNGDTRLVLGALGSFSRINQSFSRSVPNAIQDTLYTVDLSNVNGGNFLPPNNLYDYVIPTNHSFTTQERQTLSGFGGGITASISRGGFFSDGLFKFNLLNLTRTSTSSDTYLRQLSIAQVNDNEQNFADQVGCISVLDSSGESLFPTRIR